MFRHQLFAYLLLGSLTIFTPYQFEVYSVSDQPIYGIEVFSPIQTSLIWQKAIPANEDQRYILNFANGSDSDYIFVYQSTDGTSTYKPLLDPSFFGSFTGNTSHNGNIILTNTMVQHISYTISKELDGSLLLHVTSADQAINFLSYNKEFLYLSLHNSNITTEEPVLLDPSCGQYYCGSISASFKDTLPGEYDISVQNGLSTIAYIPDSIQIQKQTATDTNGGIYIQPTISVNKAKTTQPLLKPIATKAYIQITVSKKEKTVKTTSLIQVIANTVLQHIKDIFYAIRSII